MNRFILVYFYTPHSVNVSDDSNNTKLLKLTMSCFLENVHIAGLNDWDTYVCTIILYQFIVIVLSSFSC